MNDVEFIQDLREEFMKIVSVKSNLPILKELPDPICGDNEIIVELKSCGICGSDIGNIFNISSKPTEKIGHEISGKVLEIGKNVNLLKTGDRVIVNHHCSCNNCYFCMHGNETMCDKFTEEIEPCGLAQKFVISSWILKNKGVFKIPEQVTFKDATLVEPFACCLRAWKKVNVQKNDSVMIFGFGTIGIFHSIIAKKRGLHRIIIEHDKFRINFGKKEKIGEEFFSSHKDLVQKFDSKIDLCIIANPDVSCISKAIKVVRKGGSILFFGEPKENSKVRVDMSEIYSKEITLTSSYSATNEEFISSIEFLVGNQDKFSKVVSHEFSFENALEAIELAKNGDNRIKVVVSNI